MSDTNDQIRESDNTSQSTSSSSSSELSDRPGVTYPPDNTGTQSFESTNTIVPSDRPDSSSNLSSDRSYATGPQSSGSHDGLHEQRTPQSGGDNHNPLHHHSDRPHATSLQSSGSHEQRTPQSREDNHNSLDHHPDRPQTQQFATPRDCQRQLMIEPPDNSPGQSPPSASVSASAKCESTIQLGPSVSVRPSVEGTVSVNNRDGYTDAQIRGSMGSGISAQVGDGVNVDIDTRCTASSDGSYGCEANVTIGDDQSDRQTKTNDHRSDDANRLVMQAIRNMNWTQQQREAFYRSIEDPQVRNLVESIARSHHFAGSQNRTQGH